MCGFIGTVGYVPENKEKFLNLLYHRGPDGIGEWEGKGVFFGHCRLAIIDIKGGRQPWVEGGKVLIYNGEVYNFLELRKELESEGVRFRSRSDTEVVFKVIEKYGLKGIPKFNGMFAFGFWDGKKLILARDRFGIKPLYWTISGKKFAFSSEIKPLLNLPFTRKSPNLEALKYHLTFLWCPHPITAFEGIYKLPPGHALIYENGNMEIKPYFSYDTYHREVNPREVLNMLKASIKMHMISDVEVGIFLSGGIDSSSIASLTGKPLRAFSLVFEEEDIRKEIFRSEYGFAEEVARLFSHSIYPIKVSFDTEDFKKVIWHLEEPVGDGAAISNFLLSRGARDMGIKVVLAGTGGDELWGGYPRYKALLLSEKMPFLKFLPELPFSKGFLGRLARDINKFKSAADKPFPVKYLLWMSYYRGFPEVFERFMDEFNNHDILNSCMMFDVKYFLPEHNLLYTDKTSMAFGLEVRVPMLSNELFEIAFSTPSNKKVSLFVGKKILKEALRGVLPERILKRRKAGFGAPVKSWVSGKLKFALERTLKDTLILSLVPRHYVENVIYENLRGKGFTYLNALELIVISTWREVFSL